MNYTDYHHSTRGLRKVAANNGCGIQVVETGVYDVFDAETNALVAYDCSPEQVLALFS